MTLAETASQDGVIDIDYSIAQLVDWINDSDMKSILLLATHDCAQCTIWSRLGSKAFCTKTIIVFPTAPVLK